MEWVSLKGSFGFVAEEQLNFEIAVQNGRFKNIAHNCFMTNLAPFHSLGAFKFRNKIGWDGKHVVNSMANNWLLANVIRDTLHDHECCTKYY